MSGLVKSSPHWAELSWIHARVSRVGLI